MFDKFVLTSALLLAACQLPNTSWAQKYITQGGTITWMSNTASNTQSFTVAISGGGETCINNQATFNLADSPDAATFQRAYAAALLALVTGMPVYIYNYQDTTCNHASYVGLNQ
jgi:hypothetical protein